MRTRLEEIEDLLETHKIWDWIGDSCDWDKIGMKEWEKKLDDYVKLRIEKYLIEQK